MSSDPKKLGKLARQQLFEKFYVAALQEDTQAMLRVLNEDPNIIDIPNPLSIASNNTALYTAVTLEKFDSVHFLILQGAKIDSELLIKLQFWNYPSRTNTTEMLGILIKNIDLRRMRNYYDIFHRVRKLCFTIHLHNFRHDTYDLQTFKNVQSVILLLVNHGMIIDDTCIRNMIQCSQPPYTRLIQVLDDSSKLLKEVASKSAEIKVVQELVKSLDDYSKTVRGEEIQEKQKIVDTFGPGDSKSKGEEEQKAKAEVELETEKLTKMPLINARNNDGDTALHLAASNNRDDIVALLLQHGARTDLLNNENNTALQVASQCNRGKVVSLIETHEKEKLYKKDISSLKNPEKEAGAAALPPKLS